MPNLFEQFDELIEYRNQVLQYANSLCRQLHEAEARAAKKIITTLGYDLGIACPSSGQKHLLSTFTIISK